MQINDSRLLATQVRSDILPHYASDEAFAAAIGITPTEGLWYYNTTLHCPRYYGASAAPQTLLSDAVAAVKTMTFRIDGYLRTITGLDYTVAETMTIATITAFREIVGTAGSTIIDINKNGTTLFTNQANRPTFAYTDALKTVSVVPTVTSLTAGDLVSIDIDQVEAGEPQNLWIKISS